MGDTDDEPLINTAQAVCQSVLMQTDLFLSQLIVEHTPMCLKTLVNYPLMMNKWSTLLKHHSRLAVVAVLRLSLSITCLAVVAVLRLSLIVNDTTYPDWHEDHV